jgi:hypothetical protein
MMVINTVNMMRNFFSSGTGFSVAADMRCMMQLSDGHCQRSNFSSDESSTSARAGTTSAHSRNVSDIAK